MKSLFWSYPLPRTEQDLFTKSHQKSYCWNAGSLSQSVHGPGQPSSQLRHSMVQGSHHLIWDCPWVQGSHHLIWVVHGPGVLLAQTSASLNQLTLWCLFQGLLTDPRIPKVLPCSSCKLRFSFTWSCKTKELPATEAAWFWACFYSWRLCTWLYIVHFLLIIFSWVLELRV